MNCRWQIRKVANLLAPNWTVHDPDGSWTGKFHTWRDAMNRINEHLGFADAVERWLMEQV